MGSRSATSRVPRLLGWKLAVGNVNCEAAGARVVTERPLLHLTQIRSWLAECETLRDTLKGKASQEPIEPNLRVVLESKGLGQIEVAMEITPDTLSQEHRFLANIDRSYLPGLITQLKTLLRLYPIVGDKAE